MTLLIVESPTKAKTIAKFLGRGYRVESSYGHVRDLPKSRLGIRIEDNFEPEYIIPVKNRKRVSELKKEVAKADRVILATDEDREGEAIAWHLASVFGIAPESAERIVFHEITEKAIQKALTETRGVKGALVDAQQARRILDRLVGYTLSPFLWKKVMSGLSAGRVQSVALRLIVEREHEIKAFTPETYYTVTAELEAGGAIFVTDLVRLNDRAIPKPGIPTLDEAERVVDDIKRGTLTVAKIEQGTVKRNPLPPFTTSTLQQESSRRLRLSAERTMSLAQGLYERGFITYMRTDSVNLSSEALESAGEWIRERLGKEYALPEPRRFKTKSRGAQEAHEAIRPTNPAAAPKKFGASPPLEGQEAKLYELIWSRFIASQLPQAVFATARAEIGVERDGRRHTLASAGSTLTFDGFLKVWPTEYEERTLPVLVMGSAATARSVSSEEHATQPPARYNEASLIKVLEAEGIGRPSTYAPTISVIAKRHYVTKNADRRFSPTEIGETVSALLVEHFPKIVDIAFTREMEERLDGIAEGKSDWRKIVGDFYTPFAKLLKEKTETVAAQKPTIETDEVCEKCGKPMVIRWSRFGKFIACSGYPECKNIKNTGDDGNGVEETSPCPKCETGEVRRKRTKRGRIFYGCTRYPDCDYASWKKPEAEEKKEGEEAA